MRLKNLIPASLRLSYKVWQRKRADKQSGLLEKLAQQKTQQTSFTHTHKLQQPIRKSYLYENKVHNIRVAAAQINQVIIKPHEVFSFWNILGAPTKENNYKVGRNIINGKLVEDVGGGLCQVSGILYYLSLQCGLTILERHNHSKDIYTEEERFTPLGSDATIVFGYKDLRIQNPFSFSIQFQFIVEDDSVELILKSEHPIERHSIEFIRHNENDVIQVDGFIEKEKVNESIYSAEG